MMFLEHSVVVVVVVVVAVVVVTLVAAAAYQHRLWGSFVWEIAGSQPVVPEAARRMLY